MNETEQKADQLLESLTAKPEKNAEQQLEGAEAAQMLKPYGVGIDTHSKFIAVCVLKRRGDKIFRSEKDFGTEWLRLKEAASWVRLKLPEVPYEELDYCIESTGTYHMPVLQAFEGRPSIVNPMLAGATHRKTDVLDARMLAKQSMTNTWPRSFVPGEQGQILRVLWNQRREAARGATRCFNRVNNILLRFGHTFAAKTPCRSQEGLAILDALAAGQVVNHPGIKPEAIPQSMRPVIKKLLDDGERLIAQTKEAASKAIQFASEQLWLTEDRAVQGGELLDILQTVPGVGIGTAMVWLAEVVDPRRFVNSKQVAAYCGCDPSLKVSAGKVTEHVRRKGNLKLHEALLQCATAVLSRGTTPLAKWGQNLANKTSKGGFRKARGAIARRIGTSLWHVHRKAEEFTYDGYNFHRETAPIAPPLPGLTKDGKTFILDPNVKPIEKTKKANEKRSSDGDTGSGGTAKGKPGKQCAVHGSVGRPKKPATKSGTPAERHGDQQKEKSHQRKKAGRQ